MKKPYPGYPPSYKIVDETGGLHRSCLVIEFLSPKPLTNSEIAMIQEKIEVHVDNLKQIMVSIEEAQVVTPDRFDPILREGLRLS
jgi:hypothetical protein